VKDVKVIAKYVEFMCNIKEKSPITASAGCRDLGADSVSYSVKKNSS
jgi:hypothetical protein